MGNFEDFQKAISKIRPKVSGGCEDGSDLKKASFMTRNVSSSTRMGSFS
jgi:hypothetical protein